MRSLVLPLLVSLGCGSGSDSYLLVTVDKRPAVHDPVSLDVTLSNADSMYSHSLELDGHEFPVTFTISAPGRDDDLGITIDAKDSMDTLVGRGVGTAKIADATTMVTLESADFVVNSEYANDQFLTDDFETVGLQLAASTDGTWLVAYRDGCDGTGNCDIHGRRFDTQGLPVFSQIAAGDIAFNLNTDPTTSYTSAAAAASGTSTAAFWDYEDPVTFDRGIACRVLDDQGAATTTQVAVTSAPTDVVAATGITAGNYALVWEDDTTFPYSIHGAIVTPACAPAAGSPFVVSATTPGIGTSGAARAHVAANGTTLLFSWITDNDLWIRKGNTAGPSDTEMRVVTATATQTIEHVRVTPWQDGFAIAVRWASLTMDGPGKIEVYRLGSDGVLVPTPTLVTDASRSDFASNDAFSIAERASDHALLVVWHVCEAGPGLCDVFGRLITANGDPAGDAFVIPTSTVSEQVDPSVVSIGDAFVVAWTDSSGEAPDRSGRAVRARVITPGL